MNKQELEKIKQEIIKQLENLPESQREQAKQEINSMSEEQLENFLKKNNMVREQQNPFRLIVEGKIPSKKIAENQDAIAVLEINPISRGHSIIISKQPTKQPSEKTQELAQQIALLLKQKLSPKNVLIGTSEILGETIVNVLPIYENENFESPRKPAEDKELNKIIEELKKETKKEIKEEKPKRKPRKTPINRLPKAPKRMP